MAQITDNSLEARLADLLAQVRALRTPPWSRQITATAGGANGSGAVYTLDELAALAEAGTPGPQGPAGPAGPAGTIVGATATALPTGAPPGVTLGGTPSARTFDFQLPAGPPRSPGPARPAG